MESVLGRYRNLIFLVGVLFLQFLGLAVQVKRSNDVESTRLIRIWAVGAITPLERTLVWGQNATGNLWHDYIYLRGVRTENRQLKEQIEQLRLEQGRLNEDAAQAHRLQALLAFKEQFISKTVAAQVIGSSGSDLSRIVYIDKGDKDGLKRDMAVITADGIVGKVWEVYPSVSKVLVINDQSSGVGVLLEKTRLQGVLRGTPNGEVVLERVMSDEQVPPGEAVVTSGGDRIFPKGLPVGTVTKVGAGKELFLDIRVRPAARLSKLEEVLVVVEKQEEQPVAQDAVRVRAADILAQRLPSVPVKPAAATVPGNAAATTGTTAAGTNSKPQTQPKAVARPVGTPPVAGSPVRPPNTVAGQPAGVAAPKAAAQKTPPAGTALQPFDPSAKPAKPQTKPAATPPDSQPPTQDDSPH
jgi:rod shape-determining protein MreC